jgi:hypothetical protein
MPSRKTAVHCRKLAERASTPAFLIAAKGMKKHSIIKKLDE